SPARPSRMFFSKPASLSAWTARAHGATMSSSSGFGDPSNTRRCISELTRQWRRLAPRSPVIFASIIPADHIRALTGRRQIRPISTGCRRSRRPEPGRHSTYQTGKTAQTNRASYEGHIRKIVDWVEGARQAGCGGSAAACAAAGTLRSIWVWYYDTKGEPIFVGG